MSQSINCHKCQKPIPLIMGSIHRTDECPYCNASMRCCKMCKFYDIHSYNECHESIAERLVDKEKANFCDFFSPGNPVNPEEVKEKTKVLFDSLFKK